MTRISTNSRIFVAEQEKLENVMDSSKLLQTVKPLCHDMQVKQSFFRRKLRKAKTVLINMLLKKYRMCLQGMKKYISRTDTPAATERRKSTAKLHPLPDRGIRRVASRRRRPTDELTRLRMKGEDWTANDLFRFQYSDPESGSPEERKQLCIEWLGRLHVISKKFCYLAWYEAAIYACYYRIAVLVVGEEKAMYWEEVRREYAEIFLMGRRIWRRPSHPSRLRVFYDLAVLCARFGYGEDDQTSIKFRDLLKDANNFDFKTLGEVEFMQSIDKVTTLENFVIDQFFSRRKSGSASARSSLRSKATTAQRSTDEADAAADALQNKLLLEDECSPLPKIVVEGPSRGPSRTSSFRVRFNSSGEVEAPVAL